MAAHTRTQARRALQRRMISHLARGLFSKAMPVLHIGQTHRLLPLPSLSIVSYPVAPVTIHKTIPVAAHLTIATVASNFLTGRVWRISCTEPSIRRSSLRLSSRGLCRAHCFALRRVFVFIRNSTRCRT
jgi:hypothetical protein